MFDPSNDMLFRQEISKVLISLHGCAADLCLWCLHMLKASYFMIEALFIDNE